MPSHAQRRGFTLITTIVAIGVFAILLLTVYSIASLLTRVSRANLLRATALAVAEQQMEIIRNVPFDSIGTSTTYPTGPLLDTQQLTRNGATFYIDLSIGFVDDPADGNALGTIVNKPVDTAPADYKKVEIQVCWDDSACAKPIRLTTLIAPKNLESTGNTGSLFINVIDASGQPVAVADVTVTNSANPAINIVTTTDVNGQLQLLNLPPAQDTYHIVVSKSGYSSDGTLPVSAGNPNPKKPDTSVVLASVTNTTFAIDRVSTLTVRTLDQATCSAIAGLSVRIRGQRLIGETPDVYLYDQTLTLDGTGSLTINDLPWDNYTVFLNTTTYDVAGINPPDQVVINPNTVVNVDISLATSETHTLRIAVRDNGSLAPIASAQVNLTDGGGYSQTFTTDQGYIEQADWSGGAGQSVMSDPTRYATHAGAPDTTTTGQVSIAATTVTASTSETFDTTANRDAALTSADWSTSLSLLQLPPDPNAAGLFLGSGQGQSEKLNGASGKIVSATLTVTDTLNGQAATYALSADGSTYEVVTPGVPHTFASPGSDLRWRILLTSSDATTTPTIDGLAIDYQQEQRPTMTATITSSTFDLGTVTNFSTLSWEPLSQPLGAGLTPTRWQTAVNDDGASWNYVGPDGTDQTYYTASGSSLHSGQSGHRYFRYKLYLSTDDPELTPTINHVRVIRNNSCIAPGQVFFSPLPAATDYTMTVTATGYEPYSDTVTVNGDVATFADLTPTP